MCIRIHKLHREINPVAPAPLALDETEVPQQLHAIIEGRCMKFLMRVQRGMDFARSAVSVLLYELEHLNHVAGEGDSAFTIALGARYQRRFAVAFMSHAHQSHTIQ